MSSSLIIAAVTEALRTVLSAVRTPLLGDPQNDTSLASAEVTAFPPKQVPLTTGKHRLNLFLFEVRPNAALRNADVPPRGAPGDRSPSGLAFDLHYLMTAYGADSKEISSHRLLGRAMAILGDGRVVPEVRRALTLDGASQDAGFQCEAVRSSPMQLSIDDMSKLWTMFQSDYRLSVAYQVSVILIEQPQIRSSALPVLSPRITVTTSTGPRLDRVTPPFNRPSALLGSGGASSSSSSSAALPGDVVKLKGERLSVEDSVSVRDVATRVEHVLAPIPDGGGNELRFTLPDDASGWSAGVHTVSVISETAGIRTASNELPLAIAPRLLFLDPSTVDHASSTLVTAWFSPAVRPDQRLSLLVGGQELVAASRDAIAFSVPFDTRNLRNGTHLASLRVDGIDSPLTDDSLPQLTFSATAPRLTVTGAPL